MKKKQLTLFLTTALLTAFLGGCVERLIKVTTDPPGAMVWINDEEVGATPVEVTFQWYGTNDVIIRKDNYSTIVTTEETKTPFYEWPVIDFVSEILLPVHLKDVHNWHYELTPLEENTNPQKLIDRAKELKSQAGN